MEFLIERRWCDLAKAESPLGDSPQGWKGHGGGHAMAVQYSAGVDRALSGYGMVPIVAGAAGSESIKGRPEQVCSPPERRLET